MTLTSGKNGFDCQSKKLYMTILSSHSSATEGELIKLDISKDILKRMVESGLIICSTGKAGIKLQSEYHTKPGNIFSKEQEDVYNKIIERDGWR